MIHNNLETIDADQLVAACGGGIKSTVEDVVHGSSRGVIGGGTFGAYVGAAIGQLSRHPGKGALIGFGLGAAYFGLNSYLDWRRNQY
jgi:hypothetical protein